MYVMADTQPQMTYTIIISILASIRDNMLFLWMREMVIVIRCQLMPGMAAFAAACCYICVVMCWGGVCDPGTEGDAHQWAGTLINNTFRYADWELSVLLLFINIALTTKAGAALSGGRPLACQLTLRAGFPHDCGHGQQRVGEWN